MKFPRAEAFDILGVATFLYVLVLSVRWIFFEIPFSEWVVWSLFVIGVGGLVIDGVIVYRTYVRRN